MKTNRLLALLLAAVMLLSIFTGCNTVEPNVTDPSGSIGSADPTGTDGTDSTTGTSDPAGDETISGTETTEPSTTPTTEPSEPTTEPTTQPTTPETNPSTQPSECSHNWSDWTTKKEATCTADGSEERTCSKCGEKEQRAATATGHSYGSWSTTKSATCDTNGVKTRTCRNCDKVETQTIAATGHAWDEGKVAVTPTSCSDMGVKNYTCTACGRTKTEQIKGNHTFGDWQWEEYTYTVDYGYTLPGGSQYATYTSHRKIRICAKCGYKETDGTPDHICQKGSDNHVVTKVKEGTCTIKSTMRSTCKICGWYVEYEGFKAKHNWVDKEVHLSDYGPYTNELDATVSECISCGERSVVYHRGEGWSDNNRYRVSLAINPGSAYAGAPVTDNFDYVDHPEWQTVERDFVYDSDGYVKQFTLYWWYNGSRYSQVINCGEGEMEAWFTEYGLPSGTGYKHHIKCYGTYWAPCKVSWTS